MKKTLLLFLLPLILVSCKEPIDIDVQEGPRLIGVEGAITDEMKRQEVILSYSAPFYSEGAREMISSAVVYVISDIDTVFFYEDTDNKGHYLTAEPYAAERCRVYRLYAEIPDEEDGVVCVSAESYMNDNVDHIDSLVLHPYVMNGTPLDDIIAIYPYFQSLNDPNIVYLTKITKNDTLVTDTLSKMQPIPIGGYAGYYINGPLMQMFNMEIPIGFFSRDKLRNGDDIRVDFYSIPMDYRTFITNVNSSVGSNPMMGAPSNVPTNISPQGRCVGWFYAASCVSAETTYLCDSMR